MIDDADLVVIVGSQAHLTRRSTPTPASNAGTPTNPPCAASTASSACESSATTSTPASRHSPPASATNRPSKQSTSNRSPAPDRGASAKQKTRLVNRANTILSKLIPGSRPLSRRFEGRQATSGNPHHRRSALSITNTAESNMEGYQ
jgi:hypothetical protein